MAIENGINRLKREMGIKRCLLVDGNVGDVFLVDRKILVLKDYIMKIARDMGYEDVIYWDRISGMEGDVSRIQIVDEIEDEDGDEYDIGDIHIPSTANTASSCTDVGDMFNVVLRNLKDETKRTVFILNWSDYLFSTGQLDPLDRENITILGKAIRDLPPKHTQTDPASTVIILADKASAFPLSFYNGNPEVRLITLSKPDRLERKGLLERIAPSFSIKGIEDISGCDRTEEFVDMMTDFTNREIIQMANLSRKEGRMTYDKLFYLFKYGEKENPWEKLDTKSLRNFSKTISQRVIGQDDAIEKVEEVIIKAFMGLTGMHKASSRSMPKGVLFFVGPTGVGKTELSKALAKFLFGDEEACIRFDMSEYAQENSDQKLIGAPPGYVGFEEGGRLTNAVREKPFCVVLFDEIEKAAKPNPRILDIFLQILEDGRLTDSRGETTFFTDSIIIFTSNLGASEVVNSNDRERVAEDFIKIVKDYFDNELKRPELLGRISYSNIVPFNFINDQEFTMNIIRSKFKPIKNGIFEKFKIELELENENEFLKHILKGADTSKGGRDLLNALNDRLLSPLSRFLFENFDDLRNFKGATMLISVEDDRLAFDFED